MFTKSKTKILQTTSPRGAGLPGAAVRPGRPSARGARRPDPAAGQGFDKEIAYHEVLTLTHGAAASHSEKAAGRPSHISPQTSQLELVRSLFGVIPPAGATRAGGNFPRRGKLLRRYGPYC